MSDVSIVAGEDCTLYVMEGAEFNLLFEESIDTMRAGKQFAEHLFIQAYTRVLNFYRTDAKTRYMELLKRCPRVVNKLPLQDIASYLRVTPVTISKIRKELLSE
jgi:CRP-like cAMP-binding protein